MFFFSNFFFIWKSSMSLSQELEFKVSKVNRQIIFLVFDHVSRVIVSELVYWHKFSPVLPANFFQILQPTHFISKIKFSKVILKCHIVNYCFPHRRLTIRSWKLLWSLQIVTLHSVTHNKIVTPFLASRKCQKTFSLCKS